MLKTMDNVPLKYLYEKNHNDEKVDNNNFAFGKNNMYLNNKLLNMGKKTGNEYIRKLSVNQERSFLQNEFEIFNPPNI